MKLVKRIPPEEAALHFADPALTESIQAEQDETARAFLGFFNDKKAKILPINNWHVSTSFSRINQQDGKVYATVLIPEICMPVLIRLEPDEELTDECVAESVRFAGDSSPSEMRFQINSGAGTHHAMIETAQHVESLVGMEVENVAFFQGKDGSFRVCFDLPIQGIHPAEFVDELETDISTETPEAAVFVELQLKADELKELAKDATFALEEVTARLKDMKNHA